MTSALQDPANLDQSGHRHVPRVALVAHDAKKDDMARWAAEHRPMLVRCDLVATGTTGLRVMQACPDLQVRCLKSGPLGGDQQIGALIAEGGLDMLVFFVDPLSAMPHDVDVKALLRIALVYDLPCAFSPSTADLLLRSGMLTESRP